MVAYETLLNNMVIEHTTFFDKEYESIKNKLKERKIENEMIGMIEFKNHRIKIYTNKEQNTLELESYVFMRLSEYNRKSYTYEKLNSLNIYEFLEQVKQHMANTLIYEILQGNIEETSVIHKKERK